MRKVAIHSVPRSGSSWLGEIINSDPNVNYCYQPLFSYKFKSRLDEFSTREDIDRFFRDISQSNDSFIRQTEARNNNEKPSFYKLNTLSTVVYKEVRYHHIIENLIVKEPEIKVIGLVRDPRGVINSWYNASREFRRDLGWNLKEELILAERKNKNLKEEYFGLLKWAETSELFEELEKKYPRNFKLVEYHDLISNTESLITRVFDFLGLELTEFTSKFICEDLFVDSEYSVYKNKISDDAWRYGLSIDIQREIENFAIKNKLERYLR